MIIVSFVIILLFVGEEIVLVMGLFVYCYLLGEN